MMQRPRTIWKGARDDRITSRNTLYPAEAPGSHSAARGQEEPKSQLDGPPDAGLIRSSGDRRL